MRRPELFRRITAGAATALLSCALFMGSHTADAAFTSCVSDPTVLLSNGAVVDLQATIRDSYGSSDVRGVVYTVRVPSGLTVVSIVKTGGILGTVETVTVSSDDSANTFDTTTTVNTGHSASVTAVTTTVSVLNVTLGSATALGTSGHALTMHYTSLLSGLL